MRKIIVQEFISLDGIMQAPGGPEEDPTGDFKFGGWSFGYWDDLMGNVMSEYMEQPFELLLGRKTYEIFAAHWPYLKDDPVAEKFNKINKYVVSKTLKQLKWNNSHLISDNVINEIKKLKEQDGPELQVHGSSNFIQTLLENNLADEYRVWTFPVTLGKGKRFFGEGTQPQNFKLLNITHSSTGVIISAYQPGGDIKMGSFAIENPTDEELERRKNLS